jgi:hypothetical protein
MSDRDFGRQQSWAEYQQSPPDFARQQSPWEFAMQRQQSQPQCQQSSGIGRFILGVILGGIFFGGS